MIGQWWWRQDRHFQSPSLGKSINTFSWLKSDLMKLKFFVCITSSSSTQCRDEKKLGIIPEIDWIYCFPISCCDCGVGTFFPNDLLQHQSAVSTSLEIKNNVVWGKCGNSHHYCEFSSLFSHSSVCSSDYSFIYLTKYYNFQLFTRKSIDPNDWVLQLQ